MTYASFSMFIFVNVRVHMIGNVYLTNKKVEAIDHDIITLTLSIVINTNYISLSRNIKMFHFKNFI